MFGGLAANVPKLGVNFVLFGWKRLISNRAKPDSHWNRAVSEAEKIVGYPSSYLNLRCLFNDDIANIAIHIRKLVGTNHPLLRIGKRLIYNGRNNMQTRGLIVLLVSKAAGHRDGLLVDQEKPIGVSNKQRSLAEITELIHTAFLIHKGVVNTTARLLLDDGTALQDMEYGNKIAVLGGDYLLANASLALATLRNTHVVEIICGAMKDSTESEFLGQQDAEGSSIPTASVTIQDWEAKHFLASGSLLARSCRAAMMLADLDERFQTCAFEFGKHVSLAWQAHSDLQPFVDLSRYPPGTTFELLSSPVIYHIQQFPSVVSYIQSFAGSLDELDFSKLHSWIMDGKGVDQTKRLCRDHSETALAILGRNFRESASRLALENIIHSLNTH